MEKKTKDSERPFLSLGEACEYLSLKPATLYSYTHKRVLPFYKVRGRKLYFLKDDLDNFILNEGNLVKSVQQIEDEAAKHFLTKDKGGAKWKSAII